MDDFDDFEDQLAGISRKLGHDDYDDYYDFEDYGLYGQGEEIDIDRPATFKEQQAVGFGEIGVGKGAMDRRIGKTPEDVASEKIRVELESGTYDFLNKSAKESVKNRLLNYKNFTMAYIPPLVGAAAWIEQNPKKKQPNDRKTFEKFCKKLGGGVSALDVLRYIRSLKSFEK